MSHQQKLKVRNRRTYVQDTPGAAADGARYRVSARPHQTSAERNIVAGRDLFRAGETGEAIYCFVEGWAALYNVLEDGRKQILQFAYPGAVLAFSPERGGVMDYSAQAITDVKVRVTSHERLFDLYRGNPEIGLEVARTIARDRSLAFDHLVGIGRRSARERIAHLLLELFVRSRMRWPGHHSEELCLPLTQEHIGDATGLTGVHVNRALRALGKEGIVEFHYRRLRILNPDQLVDAAGLDPQVAQSWINDNRLIKLIAGEAGDPSNVVRLDGLCGCSVPVISRPQRAAVMCQC